MIRRYHRHFENGFHFSSLEYDFRLQLLLKQVGGFTVSHRMLKMFRSDKSKSNSRPSITMPSAHA